MIKIVGCTGIGLFLVYFFYASSTNYKEELDEGKEVSHANESKRQIF